MTKTLILFSILTLLLIGCKSPNWTQEFDQTLSEFGHRNWIVVADYAYPSQNSEGIKTIVTGENHTEVLSYVLKQIEKSPHVKPIIMLDKELEYISEKDAPGITNYKSTLDNLIGENLISNLPHEAIISKLDKGSELFKILIIKTKMTIPYTSVFINLDCDYWNAEKEQRMRDAISKATN